MGDAAIPPDEVAALIAAQYSLLPMLISGQDGQQRYHLWLSRWSVATWLFLFTRYANLGILVFTIIPPQLTKLSLLQLQ
ncbi:hypothetical protein EIP86_000049 [Pleurotus ostreatoroseus]|nr:hypothetical protein EIP86_000049 [Pleurotus ostreatoroseus]